MKVAHLGLRARYSLGTQDSPCFAYAIRPVCAHEAEGTDYNVHYLAVSVARLPIPVTVTLGSRQGKTFGDVCLYHESTVRHQVERQDGVALRDERTGERSVPAAKICDDGARRVR